MKMFVWGRFDKYEGASMTVVFAKSLKGAYAHFEREYGTNPRKWPTYCSHSRDGQFVPSKPDKVHDVVDGLIFGHESDIVE